MPFTSDNPVPQNMSNWSRVKRESPLAQLLIRQWPEFDNTVLIDSIIEHLIRGSTPKQIANHLDNIVATTGLGPETSKIQEFPRWLFGTRNCWLFKEKEWLSKRSQVTGESNAAGSLSDVSSNVENPSTMLPLPEQRMARSPTPNLETRSTTIATPSSINNMFTDLIDENNRLTVTYAWIKNPLNKIKTGLTSTKCATINYIQDAENNRITAQRLSLEALTSVKQEEAKNKKLNNRLEELESQLHEKRCEIAERNAKVTTLQYEIQDLKATVKKVTDTADELYAWKVRAIENRCAEIDEEKAELEDAIDKTIERGFGNQLVGQFTMQELTRPVVSPEKSVNGNHHTRSEDLPLPQGDNNILSCIFEQSGPSKSVSEEDGSPDNGEVRSVIMPYGEQEDVWYDETDDVWRNNLGVRGHIGPNMTFVPLSPSPTPRPESSVYSVAEIGDFAETDNTGEDAASASQFRPFEYHKCPNGRIFFTRWDEEQQIWETDTGDRGHFDTEGNFQVFYEDSDSDSDSDSQCDSSSEVENENEELSHYGSNSESDNESDKAEEWEYGEEDITEDWNGSFDCGDYSDYQPTLSSRAEDEDLSIKESLWGQGDESPSYDQQFPASSLPSATPQTSVLRSSNDMIVNLAPAIPQLDNGLERMNPSLKRSADHDPLELPNAKRQRPNEDQALNTFLSNVEAMMQVNTQQKTEVESCNGDSEEDKQEMISYLTYLQQRIRPYFAQYAEISTKFLNICGSHHTTYETAIKDLKQQIGTQLTLCFYKMVRILTQNIRNSNRHYITTLRTNLNTIATGDVHEDAERLALSVTEDHVVGEVLQECVKLFNAILKAVGCGSSMKTNVKIVYTVGPEVAEVIVL